MKHQKKLNRAARRSLIERARILALRESGRRALGAYYANARRIARTYGAGISQISAAIFGGKQ